MPSIPNGIDYNFAAQQPPPLTDTNYLLFNRDYSSPPKPKAALLLHSLPQSMNNIVDNLQTKEDLTYDHVYQRLLDLKTPSAINSADNEAYKSPDVKGKGKAPGRKPPLKGNSGPKECTWCIKHYGGIGAKGHP